MRLLVLLLSLVSVNTFTNSFLYPLYPSYKLVKNLSKKANIDKSHNHHHSKEVLFWSGKIIERLPQRFNKTEILIIGQSAILHDLMDSKYTNYSSEVRRHLSRFHRKREIDVIMNIINTISYSKVYVNNTVCYPEWIKNSSYINMYHIVREADLLSSYNIARMIEFRKNKKLANDILIDEVNELYNERMAKLTEVPLFYFPTTTRLAKSLNDVAKLKLSLLPNLNLDGNLDILRLVNHLTIYDLINNLEKLTK